MGLDVCARAHARTGLHGKGGTEAGHTLVDHPGNKITHKEDLSTPGEEGRITCLPATQLGRWQKAQGALLLSPNTIHPVGYSKKSGLYLWFLA